MRLLTFMEMDEIERYASQMKEEGYIPNSSQKRLAEEVTRIVHGEEGVSTALRVTQGAAPGSSTELNAAALEAIAADMPSRNLPLGEILQVKLVDLLVNIGMQASKGEAKRLIRNGGVSINNEKISDENYTLSEKHLVEQKLLLVAVGKKNKMILRVT